MSTTSDKMYLECATRSVNLFLHKDYIQLFCMQEHTPYIQARCEIFFPIRFCKFSVFYPTVKQPVPKLQHVISKIVSLMWNASSQLIECGNWEQQEVWIIYKFNTQVSLQYMNCGISQRWQSLTSILLGQIWVACSWYHSKTLLKNFSWHFWYTARTWTPQVFASS